MRDRAGANRIFLTGQLVFTFYKKYFLKSLNDLKFIIKINHIKAYNGHNSIEITSYPYG